MRGGGGGGWRSCGNSPWGPRGRGRGKYCQSTYYSSRGRGPPHAPCGASLRRCTLRRTWYGPPPQGLQSTRDWPKVEGDHTSSFTLSLGFCGKLREGGGIHPGVVVGGGGVLMCLSCFAFLGVGEASFVRAADVWGKRPSGLGPLRGGSLAADGLSDLKHGGVICGIVPRGGMGQTGWFLGDRRFTGLLLRGSSKGLNGGMGVGTGTGGGAPRRRELAGRRKHGSCPS